MNVNSLNRFRVLAWTRVVRWTAEHRFAAAYLIALLSWLPLLVSVGSYYEQGDVELYENDADDLMRGRMPYRDTLVE